MSTAAAAAASPLSPTKLSTAPAPSSTPSNPTDHIHTYHCLCTQLLLASTTPLPSLPRRGGDLNTDTDADNTTTDRAYILPLPAPPSTTNATNATTTSPDADPTDASTTAAHYALTLSLTAERAPLIVQRDDGLEKRYLARCGRCRVVVGYWLDWSQFGASSAVSGAAAAGRASGRREDVLYLLPGGLLSTRDMAAGKKSGEGMGA